MDGPEEALSPLWVSVPSSPTWVRECLLHRIARKLKNKVHAVDGGMQSLIMATKSAGHRGSLGPGWSEPGDLGPGDPCLFGSLSHVSGVLRCCLSVVAGGQRDWILGHGVTLTVV